MSLVSGGGGRDNGNFLSDSSVLLGECLVEGRVQPEVLSIYRLLLTTQGKDVQGPSVLHIPHPVKVSIPALGEVAERNPYL